MEADVIVPALAIATVVFGGWTLWTLNAGRRIARWGRRKARRIVLLVLSVAAAFYAFSS